MKNPFAKRKIAIAAAGLLAAFLFSGSVVSAAGDYYDGEKESHQTGVSSEQYGEGGSVPGTVVEHRAEKVASFVTAGSYTKNNQHVADYANGKLTGGWRVKNANGSWVNYSSYVGVLKNSVPTYSAWPASLHAVIDANGCLRYKCATCGGYQYAIDAELYGYYDSNGQLTVTGWTQQAAYCEKCTSFNDWNNVYDSVSPSLRSKWAIGTVDNVVVGHEFVPDVQDNGYGYKGVLVQKGIERLDYDGKTIISDYTVQIDPGVLENTNGVEYVKMLLGKKGQMIGSYAKYTSVVVENDGEMPAVEILDKITNGVPDTVPFGYHFYNVYHEYINFGKWRTARNKTCIQTAEGQDVYYYFSYGGKPLAKRGYGYVNPGKCGFSYPAGQLGYCADCGEMVTALVYATPETVATIRRMKNGTGYLYVCPVDSSRHDRCSTMILDGASFPYLEGHVENEWPFMHACKEQGLNMYYLQFESNSPDPAFFGNSTYQVGGYFYNVFEEGKSMMYTPEGQALPFSFKDRTVLENGNVIMADVTPTMSRNTVDSPKFNSKGYIFTGWELWNGSSWVSVGKNPTWKDIVTKIGSSSDLLKNDGSTIRLRAQWTAPTAVLKVVDGDTVVDGKVGDADVVGSYTVPYMRSTALSDPANKSGVLKFVSGQSGVANPPNMVITAIFSSFSDYSGNKGIFDAATKTYMNADSEDGRVDYAIANYSWQTIVLPSVKKQGYVFMGWYTGENGTGLFCGGAGAPYTPRDSATLYGYWKPDTMTIGATVQSPNGHIDGISDVDWNYNNSDIYGFVTYKIYRKEGSYPNNFTFTDTLLTNGNTVGSKVDETPITFTKTGGSGEYTVQNEGVYEITLQGQAGRSVTGANGGAGATYKLTMYLKKGDKLKYDTGATTGNYGGGTGSILRGSEGTFGAGGSAATLTLNGTLVAVAGGGGGAIRLPDGTAIAGGNAVQDLSINGTKTLSSDPYTIFSEGATDGSGIRHYSVVSSGGGGGYRAGTAGRAITSLHEHKSGCFHTHEGVGDLVSGTAGTESAVYSQSGGCYTHENIEVKTCNPHSVHVDTHHWDCIGCGGINTITQERYDGCGQCSGHDGERDHGRSQPWSCSTAGCGRTGNTAGELNLTSHEYRVKTYSLNCTAGAICGLGENWGDNDISDGHKEYYTPSTGGSCWYNTSFVMSATFDTTNMNTNAQGSFSLSSKVLGITTTTSLVDKDTDDKAVPNTPVVSGALKATETVVSDSASDIYLSNISWNSVADNGTPYTFRGETWDIQTTKYEKRCSTTVNAIVTVTSGVDHYVYEVYRDGTKVASGTTTGIQIPNVKCVSGQSKAAAYSYNLKIRVQAYDKAGNYSGWGEKTVNVSYAPGSSNPGHTVGVLEKPTVQVSEGEGIYKDGNTYYVKADGVTKVPMTVRAYLSSVQKSRITSTSLGDKASSYGAGFLVQTSLTNHTVGGTTIGGSIGALVPSGSGNVVSLTNSETKASQSFTITKEEKVVVKPYAEANCLGETGIGCADSTHELSKEGNPVTIVGDKTAPKVQISGIPGSFQGENNFVDTNGGDWSSSGVDISVTSDDGDDGSGISYIIVTDSGGNVVAKVEKTSRTTKVTLPVTATEDGERTYTVTGVDNVGNKTTVEVTIRINKEKPLVTDKSPSLALGTNVKSLKPDRTTAFSGHWPSTDVEAVWEYDWTDMRTVSYKVEDEISGLKSVRFYRTNSSYGGVVEEIFSKNTEGENPVYIFHDISVEGTSYYNLEAVNMAGNKTVVHIKARRDSTAPTFDGAVRNVIDFESFTMDKATEAVNNGSIPDILTTWVVDWKDKNYDGAEIDASGIQSAILYVYDAHNTEVVKAYPMAVKANGSSTAPRENDFGTPLDGNARYYNKTFTVSVNTFAEFPDSAELKWYVEAKDNVGNLKRQYGKVSGPGPGAGIDPTPTPGPNPTPGPGEGPDPSPTPTPTPPDPSGGDEDDVIPNFLVKTVGWATKDGAYNVKSDDGASNTPYFKTGELGFLEVWTIGYVEGLELDFSDGGIGQEAASEIERGAYDGKYALGVHGGSSRLVTTIKAHGTVSGVPNRADGVPYASHYVYSYGDVNKSIGTGNTAGWNSDGTFIRIPPSHELAKRNEKDKYGNELYFWEVREARVYASKGEVVGKKYAKAPYVIWDESGDDVHYRIIHGTLGF